MLDNILVIIHKDVEPEDLANHMIIDGVDMNEKKITLCLSSINIVDSSFSHYEPVHILL